MTDIYFSQEPNPSADEVYSGTPGSNTVTQLTNGVFERINDVEITGCNGQLWWNNWTPSGAGAQEGLYSSNADGTGQAQVTGAAESTSSNGFASGLHGIVLDSANSQVFFTRGVSYANGVVGGEVSKVMMDGTGYAKLDANGDSWFPYGIDLNTATSTLYWTSPGVIGVPFDGQVNKMTTAGAGKMALNPHLDGQGRGLALDAADGLLFYGSFPPGIPGAGGGIFVHDLSVPNSVINVLPVDPNSGIPDVEVDAANNRIYWTEYGNGLIRSGTYNPANLAAGLSGITTEISGLTNPFGLALAFCAAIGGEILPIDNTALLLAGVQSNFSILAVLAVVGAGAFGALYYSIKKKN